MAGRTMRYSEAFKQQVVDELEAGRFGSPHEASQAYGVDSGSVKRWARQYGKGDLLRKVVRVEKQDEPGEIKRLRMSCVAFSASVPFKTVPERVLCG